MRRLNAYSNDRQDMLALWIEAQAIRKPLAQLHHAKKTGAILSHDGATSLRFMRDTIKEARKKLQHVPSMKEDREEIEKSIRSNVPKHLFGDERRARTHLILKVGGKPTVNKQPKASRYGSKPTIEMTVGWFWNRNVYQRIYHERTVLASDTWFIMSADEVSINEKNIRMFRAMLYRRSTDEFIEGYVGQSKLGKETSIIRPHLKYAISGVKSIIANEFHEKITGENHE